MSVPASHLPADSNEQVKHAASAGAATVVHKQWDQGAMVYFLGRTTSTRGCHHFWVNLFEPSNLQRVCIFTSRREAPAVCTATGSVGRAGP